MYLKLHLSITTMYLCIALAVGQSPYHELAKDTIITRPIFLGNKYLLDGKDLNLEVMQWFMLGHPKAHDNIQVAIVSDQVAAVSYTIGSLSFLTGYLVSQENKAAGRDFMLFGGGSIGVGLLFSVISGSYQRRAVELYNLDIKKEHHLQQNNKVGASFQLQLSPAGLGLEGRW